MAEAYPGTAPQNLNLLSETLNLPFRASKPETGRARQRLLITDILSTLNLETIATSSEKTALDAFIASTLDSGAKAFTYTHPLTGVNHEARFLELPLIWEPLTNDLWKTQFSIQLLPNGKSFP